MTVFLGYKFWIKKDQNKTTGQPSTGILETSQETSKDYLNIASVNFDPTKAGNSNPQEKQKPSTCCSHPYYHSTWRAFSDDGLVWQKENKLLIDHASVPDVLIKDTETQIIYYVDGELDTMNCKIIKDSKITDGNCRIYNFSGQKAWDPEVVKVDDYYRLYFMSPPQFGASEEGGKPKPIGEEESSIKTAISRDGISWLEEGTAISGQGMLVDPTVRKIGDTWIMYVNSLEKGLVTAESSDGKTFQYKGLADTAIENGGSPHLSILDNQYGLYYCKKGISMATSTDAKTWTNIRTVFPQETDGGTICDPSVEKQADGKYVMYYKIQPPNK